MFADSIAAAGRLLHDPELPGMQLSLDRARIWSLSLGAIGQIRREPQRKCVKRGVEPLPSVARSVILSATGAPAAIPLGGATCENLWDFEKIGHLRDVRVGEEVGVMNARAGAK